MLIKCNEPIELAKEIFWLAWKACGSPLGMGVFQDHPDATKKEVWNNVVNQEDYPLNHNKPNEPYADYVFGRMMKFGLAINKDSIEITEKELRYDYQSWCRKYPTVQALVDQAVANLIVKG